MNAKISVFAICIEAITYLLLYNLHDCTFKDFREHEKLKYKQNKLKVEIDFLNNRKQRGVYPKFLIFDFRMFQIKMLYQYIKDSFAVPSINAIKNFNMSQKNSVNPKSFYPNSYLLLTSIFLADL